jgi:hypothetical protein
MSLCAARIASRRMLMTNALASRPSSPSAKKEYCLSSRHLLVRENMASVARLQPFLELGCRSLTRALVFVDLCPPCLGREQPSLTCSPIQSWMLRTPASSTSTLRPAATSARDLAALSSLDGSTGDVSVRLAL